MSKLNHTAVLIFSFALCAPAANSQSSAGAQATPPTRPVSMLSTDSTLSTEQRLQREQAAREFLQRQAQLRIDTAKLVALTAELQQQVNQTGINILSVDVIKKTQEIQKLAKSVQDKMRYGN